MKDSKDPGGIIDVVLIDDDEKLRSSYVDLVNSTEGMHCVGSYPSVEDALKEIEDTLPDVVLMDIGLPGMSGIEGVKMVKAMLPSADILMLTVYDDEDRIFRSICAGASGYVVKDTPPEELVAAIRGIKSGAPMSAAIARRVLEMVRRQASSSPEDFHLTARETDILQWLVEGFSEKRIAEKLFLSPLTVHSHIKHIYEKLHVHSKSEAVSRALKHRLFS